MRSRRPVLGALLATGTLAVVGVVRLTADSGERAAIATHREVTYHADIAPILQQSCQVCHRSGGIAPFALESYGQTVAFREMIDGAVRERRMPPWFASPDHGAWANDRRLPEEDRLALLAWIDQGAPEGNPAYGPPPVIWPEGWSIGAPDVVLRLDEPVEVPADGVVPYLYRYLATDFEEDRWIQALQIRPTAPEVVHHVLVLIEDPIEGVPAVHPANPLAAHSDFGLGLDGYFAAHVPGHYGVVYPEGQAKLLPQGATLKFQLHYTPNGRPTEDQTEIGFVFADEPPEYRVETGAAMSLNFVIPPGARNHEVTAMHRFEEPVSLLGFLPHMHLRGSAFRYEVHYPDGRRETVLDVPHFDFHWQEEYILADPLPLPAGSWLRATGWFDNSRHNHHNPDPSQAVRFGEQTWEEMMNGYFHYLVRNTNEEAL